MSSMVQSRSLELAARFVAALYHGTNGCPGQFRTVGDCAARAGIRAAGDIDLAVRAAHATGLIVMHINATQVMLTERGRDAAVLK